ncbi:MAG: HAD-IB family phosphatase [Gammaproteobacteria bacterium]|nr:HAD-IB family phosphatase [Gammaproteobacteria bacterium]
MTDNKTCPLMVFCDFDGTITVNETLRGMFVQWLPQQAPAILARLDAGQLSLRQALIDLTALLPSDCRERMSQQILLEPMHAGFDRFVEFLHQRDIPLVILSSGLDFYILTKLQPWLDKIHAVHALRTEIDGEHLRLVLPYDDAREAMPKATVMASYRADFNIAIGDSMSDFQIAQQADLVFARDKLLAHMQGQTKVCAWRDFDDIQQQLRSKLD